MQEGPKALIIGSGIGGIATAIILAGRGFSVSVYEKNSSPGGRCGRLIRDGHRFDLGATMLMMPGVYHEVFGMLGIDLREGKDILPLKNLYTIFFDDCSRLAFTTDTERMRRQLEAIEPGSSARERVYVRKGYRIYDLGMRRLVSRNFYSLFQMVNLKNVPLLFQLKAFTPHYRYAKRFFKSERLRMAYTFQNIYVGQDPFNSPALFSMIPAAELTEGSFFPANGGMFNIVDRLLAEAGRRGVKIYYSNPVSRILISEKRAKGIILGDGTTVEADLVVSNADLPYTYRKLLPDRRKSAHIENLKYSCSALCFHWGLDKYYPLLDQHNVFLSDNFREGLRKIFRDNSVGDDPCFYVHAPSRSDQSAAPAGQDTLSVAVGIGHIDRKHPQDWEKIRERTRKAVLDRLRKQGLADLEDHIKFEICHTPESWENECNISRGSVFGSLGHNIFQMGYFRPHNRHDKYHNLYFTGGSTHPGNGIPNVLLSAKLVTERIFKENKNLIIR
ncbi:MAG: phytoene desaturase family protein [Bacteroidales bacterium]|jgi:phytoene desaturase|nr:phytoene desaturase family protein [Bacteroidales bacterium]